MEGQVVKSKVINFLLFISKIEEISFTILVKSTIYNLNPISKVNPGDMVVTENGFSQVKLVTVVVKSGAYVPLTDAGTLMVDGVLVSCYTNAPHWLAHTVLAPLRWWPTLLLDTEESQHSEGVKAYPWMVKNLGNFLGLADVSVPNDKIESVDFPKMGMSSPRLIPNKMDKFEL